MREFLAGRQPIFDVQRRLVAHELLFRDGERDAAVFDDAEHAESASASMLSALLGGPGLEFVSAGKQVFVNCTERMLASGMLLSLPPDQVVVEVLESVPASDEVLDALRGLRQAGFRVALDDWLDTAPERRALLNIVDVVKLECAPVRALPRLATDIKALRAHGLEILVEKVENEQQFQCASEAGATLFQGYHLARPEVVRHRSVSGNPAAAAGVLALLDSERSDAQMLEESISGDPAMALRVLRLASSAALSRGRRFDTIRQAVVHLGYERIRQLLLLVMLARQPGATEHQVRVSLTRARMCELVAGEQRLEAKQAFMVGLLSNLDVLLALPLRQCLEGLRLGPAVQEALLGRGAAGGLREPLAVALAFESRERMQKLPVQDARRWQHSYLLAASWADQLVDTLLHNEEEACFPPAARRAAS